jgi:excisionase family DNA binding protein
MPATPIYIPIAECQVWFSLSRDTFYRAAKRGEISIHKVGNRSLLKVAEITNWIECETGNSNSIVGQTVGRQKSTKLKSTQ